MTIVPCPRALADFACEMRPDWDRAELEGALSAAGASRPPKRELDDHWARTVVTVAACLADPGATPRNVRAAVRDPLAREPGRADRPTAEYEAARAALTGGQP